MRKKIIKRFLPIAVYVLFILISLILGYGPGKEIGMNFTVFSMAMITVLPFF